MRLTEPEIFLIAAPTIEWDEVYRYLDSIGGLSWFDRVMSDIDSGDLAEPEALIEFMARGCYQSFAPGINPNVKKVREDSGEYLTNIKRQFHGSVMEHAQVSFMFKNVSRVFTHELVRHRAGVAISQESLRYVRITELGFRIPEVLDPMRDEIISIVETLEEFQMNAAEQFDLDNDAVPMSVKKEVTSALRRIAPIGLSTSIGWSANFRTLRHVIEQRTAAGAEEEIALVFRKVAAILQERYPRIFGDYEVQEDGSYVTPYRKV